MRYAWAQALGTGDVISPSFIRGKQPRRVRALGEVMSRPIVHLNQIAKRVTIM